MKPHDNFKAILTLSICAAQVRTQCEYLRTSPKIKPFYKALLLVVEKAIIKLEKYHSQTVDAYDEMEELGFQVGEQIENAVNDLIL